MRIHMVVALLYIFTYLSLIKLLWLEIRDKQLNDYFQVDSQEANGEILFHSEDTSETGNAEQQPFTDFKVVQGHPYQHKFEGKYKCNQTTRTATSPIFRKPNVFDFNVQITTSQNILVMGDSIGIQFSQSLQEAAGAENHTRNVLRYTNVAGDGIHLAPTRGGGVIAGYRMTGMFRETERDKISHMPNKCCGGWMSEDVKRLKSALFMSTKTNNSKRKYSPLSPSCAIQETMTTVEHDGIQNYHEIECPEEDFDVIVHQFPFGWSKRPAAKHSKSEKITFETIHEAVQLSGMTFGAKAIIIQTIPMGNFVIDMVNELEVINNAIYNYSSSYDNSHYSGQVEKVVVMDFAKFSYELFAHNAASLNLIDNDEEEIDQLLANSTITEILNPLLSDRTKCCHKEYGQILGFTCSEINRFNCLKTKYSFDGIHWCMDEVGGRINGVLACLLKCIEDNDGLPELRHCEKQCNDNFMTLRPINPT